MLGENGSRGTLEDAGEERLSEPRAAILESTTRAHPALAGGVLFARDQRELVAADLRPRP